MCEFVDYLFEIILRNQIINFNYFKIIFIDAPALREKCPNTELFVARIFPHLDWIRRDTMYLSVFSPNAGKYGPEKTLYLDTFTQCWVQWVTFRNNQYRGVFIKKCFKICYCRSAISIKLLCKFTLQ